MVRHFKAVKLQDVEPDAGREPPRFGPGEINLVLERAASIFLSPALVLLFFWGACVPNLSLIMCSKMSRLPSGEAHSFRGRRPLKWLNRYVDFDGVAQALGVGR